MLAWINIGCEPYAAYVSTYRNRVNLLFCYLKWKQCKYVETINRSFLSQKQTNVISHKILMKSTYKYLTSSTLSLITLLSMHIKIKILTDLLIILFINDIINLKCEYVVQMIFFFCIIEHLRKPKEGKGIIISTASL